MVILSAASAMCSLGCGYRGAADLVASGGIDYRRAEDIRLTHPGGYKLRSK